MVNGAIDELKVGDIKTLAWRLLLQHGPWALLCGFLIAAQFGWIGSPLRDQVANLEKVILENRKVIVDTNMRAEVNHSYQNVLLRVMCRNQVVLQQQGQCEPKYYGYEEKEKK